MGKMAPHEYYSLEMKYKYRKIYNDIPELLKEMSFMIKLLIQVGGEWGKGLLVWHLSRVRSRMEL